MIGVNKGPQNSLILVNDWSEQGCETRTVYNEEKGVYDVTCLCDHLTSFAVLMVGNHGR